MFNRKMSIMSWIYKIMANSTVYHPKFVSSVGLDYKIYSRSNQSQWRKKQRANAAKK